MPAVLEVDEMFGSDTNSAALQAVTGVDETFTNDTNLRSTRWMQLRKILMKPKTKACNDLLDDIDNARKILKDNAGNTSTTREGIDNTRIEANNDECSFKIPNIINDTSNLENKFWCRRAQSTTPLSEITVPDDVNGSDYPVIVSKAYWGIDTSIKKAQGLVRKNRKSVNEGTAHIRDNLVLPDQDKTVYTLNEGGRKFSKDGNWILVKIKSKPKDEHEAKIAKHKRKIEENKKAGKPKEKRPKWDRLKGAYK